MAVRRARVLVACLGLAITACGGGDESQDRTGPYNVGTRSLELVDEGRPTPAFGGPPERSSRTVVTDVWYPATGEASDQTIPDAPAAEGPFPLVVFNHGQQGAPEQYAITLRLWAQGGYVVAAPRHPLTIKGGPGAQFVQDMQGEIGDIPFVISQVGEQLPDLVDLDHVGVAGHSSGAIAALAAGANTCCLDDRIDAVVLEGGLDVPLDGEYFAADDHPALFYIYGDTDVNAMKSGRGQFDKAPSPKLFMTVQGGDHSDMFRVGERANLVSQATLDFLDRYLKDRDDALDHLQSTVDDSGLATVESSTS